jgi:hypothetical protein
MQLIIRILSLLSPIPAVVNYYYSEWPDIFNEIKIIVPFLNFHEGLPTIESFDTNNQLIIFDDLMNETKDNSEILDIFTK